MVILKGEVRDTLCIVTGRGDALTVRDSIMS